uniref:Uncharacterized protein n=1 Tax=Oryza barthii TaxID=65489 RepID=A0A0D3HKB8_9ORYZ
MVDPIGSRSMILGAISKRSGFFVSSKWPSFQSSAHRIDCSYAQAVQSRMIPISKDFQNLKKSLHGTVDAGDAPASKTVVSSEIQNKRGIVWIRVILCPNVLDLSSVVFICNLAIRLATALLSLVFLLKV